MVKSTGFRTGLGPQRTATLEFEEGTALHGLQIEVGLRVPVGVILAADRNILGEGVKAFVQKVIWWNLEDESGEPEPITEDVFRLQFDILEASEIVKTWIEVVTKPSAPLGVPSKNGGSSAARPTRRVTA